MQKTQVITEKRPQRAMQVVPIEPSLRALHWRIISGVPVLLLYIVNAYFTLNTELWGHSCLDAWGLYYVIFSAISLFFLPSKKALNKRRQQAARYNLTIGASKRTAGQPQSALSELPASFAIYFQRRWLGTFIIATGGSLTLIAIGISVYTYWQATFQAIQHGVPVVLTMIQNGFNSAILLLVVTSFFVALVFSPRQQLIATNDGLTYHQGYRTSYVSWQQACLFAIVGEASTGKDEPVFYYELADKNTTIRWPSTNKQVSWVGNILTRPVPSSVEFPQQIQFLNIIIAERTGLPLYDLR